MTDEPITISREALDDATKRWDEYQAAQWEGAIGTEYKGQYLQCFHCKQIIETVYACPIYAEGQAPKWGTTGFPTSMTCPNCKKSHTYPIARSDIGRKVGARAVTNPIPTKGEMYHPTTWPEEPNHHTMP